MAALPQPPASAREPAPDALAWDKVKDWSDPSALQKFISRFPDSPLALNAQRRIDTLNKAVREREEAAQKAKAAAAEAAAQKQREENERRAAAAEAELQTKNAEAARKAEEARQKGDQKARDKAAAEAEAARAAADKQAQTAEAARKQADARASRRPRARISRRGSTDPGQGSEGSGVDDLKSFSAALTCERLRPVAAAALDRFNAEAADRAAKQPNSYALVRAAQTELIRLGCFNGRPDGALAPTQTALKRYLTIIGLPADNLAVTPDVITDMTKHTTQVCPPECQSGETLKGGSCVADAKPAETSSRKERQPEKRRNRRVATSRPKRNRNPISKPARGRASSVVV